jgi:hypothetical protein
MGQDLVLHFDILGESDVLSRPTELVIRQNNKVTTENNFIRGLKYQADLLTGLNLYWLCLPKKSPSITRVSSALNVLDPHYALHVKAQDRLSHWLKCKNPKVVSTHILSQMAEIITDATSEEGLSLMKLLPLLPLFEKVEIQINRPVLFNLELDLPNEILRSFNILANLLFYVRALVLADYNQQIEDPTFEAIRMDSVNDYLPKLESVAHDAAIYSHFLRLEAQMPTLVAQRLKDVFQTYSSMGATLIDSIERIKPSQRFGKDLLEHMNRVQIDWLFGTPAGICYRLREELLAIRDGYHKVFHFDVATDFRQQNASWSFDCPLSHFSSNEYPAA